MRLRRGLQQADEGNLAAQRDFDVRPARQLEDGAAVDRDLFGLDVARHAGHADQLGVR